MLRSFKSCHANRVAEKMRNTASTKLYSKSSGLAQLSRTVKLPKSSTAPQSGTFRYRFRCSRTSICSHLTRYVSRLVFTFWCWRAMSASRTRKYSWAKPGEVVTSLGRNRSAWTGPGVGWGVLADTSPRGGIEVALVLLAVVQGYKSAVRRNGKPRSISGDVRLATGGSTVVEYRLASSFCKSKIVSGLEPVETEKMEPYLCIKRPR